MEVYKKLMFIQTKLKAPKSQYNSFGKYAYRKCEDILEALKPLLADVKAVVIISDEIIQVGDRYYVQATATFLDSETGELVYNKALAREDDSKKGMDLAQVTGSVSSYARKYALSGLLAIDDNADSDTTNTGSETLTTISEEQQKHLFEIANPMVVKTVLLKRKYTSSKDIKKADYQVVVKEIETAVKGSEVAK